MTSTNERLAQVNRSYMMDMAKRKCLEESNASKSKQSNENNEYDDVDTWKNDKLMKMREIREKRQKYLDEGNGTLEVLTEEKQLVEACKNHTRVVCHFYEEGFARCNLLDGLLSTLASRFLDTKFVKIKASSSPFFTQKFGIKVLPTLLTVINGNVAKIFVGFQEFSGDKISLPILRNTLLRHNILTDECCIIEGESDQEEE